MGDIAIEKVETNEINVLEFAFRRKRTGELLLLCV